MINDSKNVLDPSPGQIRSWARAAAELMAEYLGTIRNRPVYPYTSSSQIRERLDSGLPEEPVNFDELLHTFRDTLLELSRHNGHPRMFGYVRHPALRLPLSPICSHRR
jgi:aromatic-L-amino-acid/L-tryptophan decarboxylase